jgi:hypothetical protein
MENWRISLKKKALRFEERTYGLLKWENKSVKDTKIGRWENR